MPPDAPAAEEPDELGQTEIEFKNFHEGLDEEQQRLRGLALGAPQEVKHLYSELVGQIALLRELTEMSAAAIIETEVRLSDLEEAAEEEEGEEVTESALLPEDAERFEQVLTLNTRLAEELLKADSSQAHLQTLLAANQELLARVKEIAVEEEEDDDDDDDEQEAEASE